MSRPVLLRPCFPEPTTGAEREPEADGQREFEVLRATAERYRDFVENGLALAWSHGLDGTIQWVNRAVLRGFGAADASQVVGRDLLQGARDRRDAEDVLGNCLPRIFGRFSGAVYIDKGRTPLLEPVARWGEPLPADRPLQAAECWALRRGRLHFAEPESGGPFSPHVGAEQGTASCPRAAVDPGVQTLCAPLMAQGQALGLLHLRETAATAAGDGRDGLPSRRHLVANTAEQLALSLVNLRLRETLETRARGSEG